METLVQIMAFGGMTFVIFGILAYWKIGFAIPAIILQAIMWMGLGGALVYSFG